MPERARSESNEKDWARQLERERMRRVKAQSGDPWLPGPGAAVSVSEPATAPVRTKVSRNNSLNTQNDWGRQLERQRLQMMKEHGPWLPGPGAQAAAATAGTMGMGGGASAGSALGGISDKMEEAKKAMKQHGVIGAVFALLPPQATKAAEEATKPVLKTLINLHWDMIAALETSPISILVTGPILNLWLYKKHLGGMPGICKFDITDLFWLLLYDLIIAIICLYVVFYFMMVTLIIYVALNPMEVLGFVSQFNIF